jgi:hypothetical protein
MIKPKKVLEEINEYKDNLNTIDLEDQTELFKKIVSFCNMLRRKKSEYKSIIDYSPEITINVNYISVSSGVRNETPGPAITAGKGNKEWRKYAIKILDKIKEEYELRIKLTSK